jgi:hypothetical protein
MGDALREREGGREAMKQSKPQMDGECKRVKAANANRNKSFYDATNNEARMIQPLVHLILIHIKGSSSRNLMINTQARPEDNCINAHVMKLTSSPLFPAIGSSMNFNLSGHFVTYCSNLGFSLWSQQYTLATHWVRKNPRILGVDNGAKVVQY